MSNGSGESNVRSCNCFGSSSRCDVRIHVSKGEHRPARSRNEVLAFKRGLDTSELLIVLNLAAEPRKWEWRGVGQAILSTHLNRRAETSLHGSVLLQGNEGVILEIERR